MSKGTEAPGWKDFKRGDHVIVNDRGTSATRGRAAICIADNTETGFGHKHVQIQFDDTGQGTNLRTYELDLVLSWEDFAKSIGREHDSRGLPIDVGGEDPDPNRPGYVNGVATFADGTPVYKADQAMPDFGRKSA